MNRKAEKELEKMGRTGGMIDTAIFDGPLHQGEYRVLAPSEVRAKYNDESLYNWHAVITTDHYIMALCHDAATAKLLCDELNMRGVNSPTSITKDDNK